MSMFGSKNTKETATEPKYIICHAESAVNLQAVVLLEIKDGYAPLGAPIFATSANQSQQHEHGGWYQAMTK